MKVTKRTVSPVVAAAIGIAFTLAIAAAGWFLLVAPQRERAAELEQQITATEAQVRQARAAAARSERVEKIEVADLFRLTKAMPGENDIAGVLLELSRVAAETGIVFEQIAPQATISGETFRTQPISVSFTGNFYALSDFLYRIRNLVTVQRGRLLATGRLFSVDALQFSEGDPSFPNIRASLTISAFLYGPGSGTAPATTPAPPPTTAATPTETTPTETTPPPTEPAPAAAPSATGAP